jgi:hypothetical protein
VLLDGDLNTPAIEIKIRGNQQSVGSLTDKLPKCDVNLIAVAGVDSMDF